MNQFIKYLNSHFKYLIYLICTIGICWIGVWRDIGNGAQWAFASNCVGFCMFPMIICRYKIADFLKLPYAIWLLVYSLISYPICREILPGTDYNAQIISAVINVGLYGLLFIRLIYYLCVEKNRHMIKVSIVFWFWLGMMIFCCLSRNIAVWPFWYLVMFGSYYLAPVTKSDMSEMVKGIVDGIILSFFWIQSRAFLYRPYDLGEGGRYVGHFTNSNVNGMFYLLSLSGILTRLWITTREREKLNNKLHKVYSFFLVVLAVAILDFAMYTGSRGAFMAVLGMLGAYILADALLKTEKKIRHLIKNGMVTFVLFVLLIYPVYASIRYIPALRHHPIWYKDYSEEKVHSWDPIDSDKYTSFSQALNVSGISRIITRFIPNDSDSNDSQAALIYPGWFLFYGMNICSIYPPEPLPVITKEYPGGTWVYEYDDGIEPGTDAYHDALIDVKLDKLKDIRIYIWKYLIERLNIWGHEELVMNIYVGDNFGHAHNTFLQVAYLFGLPAGMFFLLMVLTCLIMSLFRIIKASDRHSSFYIFALTFFSGYLLFGTVECLALTGEALFTIMFIAVDILARKESALA